MESGRGGATGHRILGAAKLGELFLKLSYFRALREKRAPQNPDYRPDVGSIQARAAIANERQTGWNWGSRCSWMSF
jgi:hypothetical protein